MCVGISPKDIWANQMTAVLDMYYGARRAWNDPDVCLILNVIHTDPAYLGATGVRELVKHRESRWRFDLDRWLSELGLATRVD